MIDASVVGRVVGVTTKYQDLRGGNVTFLPQRIAVFAQAQTGQVFPAGKYQPLTAAEGGARWGYKSQIYAALRELLPVNGDGVGTIPVDVYPLSDAGGAVAAAGSIVPSGTPTKTSKYRLRIGGVAGDEFAIAAGALATAALLHNALRAIGNSIFSKLELPVTPTYAYGTVTAAAIVGTGNGTIGTFTTTGQPKPGVWRAQVVTAVTNGGVWQLTDPDGTIVSNTLTQTVGAGAATPFVAGGLGFTITDGATDFGLGAYFDITVPATALNFTAGWKGSTGNMKVEVITEDGEVTFAISHLTGGLVDPTVDAALDLVGDVWETMFLNGGDISNTTALDAFQAFGEGRWLPEVNKPLVCFTGNTISNVQLATVVSNARRTDRVNAQLVAPGSPNLPIVVAARQLARIAKLANNNPPFNYTGQKADRLVPGTDGEQWNFTKREYAVTHGSSTIEVVDGVIQICDVMTFYRPTGEEPPAYRYVVNIVKLQNTSFNVKLIFNAPDWAGAPLVRDEQVVSGSTGAKKPKMAKAALAALADNLGFAAIIGDAEAAKNSLEASIGTSNPNRLDVKVLWPLSGNNQVTNIEQNWGFTFGTPVAA